MATFESELKANPEAWIYTAMTAAQARKCGSIVYKKKLLQTREASRMLGFGAFQGSADNYYDTLSQSFMAKFGYNIQQGIARIMAGVKVERISGIYGVDDEILIDYTAGEIDPESGLPVATIEAAQRAEDKLASGFNPSVGSSAVTGAVPSSWLTHQVPTLGVDQTLTQYAQSNKTRAWTVQDPESGVVYTMTIDTDTNTPNAIYRTDNGAMVSVFDKGSSSFKSAASAERLEKFNDIFDSINVGLQKVTDMLQSIFAMALNTIALNQASKGDLTLWSQLQQANKGELNSQIASQQSDSPIFGGTGGSGSGGDGISLSTIALIGLGAYLIFNNKE